MLPDHDQGQGVDTNAERAVFYADDESVRLAVLNLEAEPYPAGTWGPSEAPKSIAAASIM